MVLYKLYFHWNAKKGANKKQNLSLFNTTREDKEEWISLRMMGCNTLQSLTQPKLEEEILNYILMSVCPLENTMNSSSLLKPVKQLIMMNIFKGEIFT